MRDEKEERKKQARSNKQTNKAKQHSTPKTVTFPRKNVHVLMRKEERSKQGQTNDKAKQHSTSKAVTFPFKKRAASGGSRTYDTLHSCTSTDSSRVLYQ